jgi:hypothetical protein
MSTAKKISASHHDLIIIPRPHIKQQLHHTPKTMMQQTKQRYDGA